MKTNRLNIKSLQYTIGNQLVLDNIELELHGNQAVTLLGPNGAGKSTLLKTLTATLHCQAGSVCLNGMNSETNRLTYLSHIGYMPETPLIITELSVLEQLKLLANIKQVADIDATLERVVDACQLQQVINKRTNTLSLGFKQRLNLAQAIMNQPQLLIMDEPLNGLDPHLIIEFRNIINKLKKDCLIIVSTHYLAEAQAISDRVLIMQNGILLDNIALKNQAEAFDLEQLYMQHTIQETGI